MAYDQIKSQQAVTAGHKTAVDFLEIGNGGVLASLAIPANGVISLRDSHDYQNYPTGIILKVGATTYAHVAVTWAADGKSWTPPSLTTGQFYYDPDYGNVVCATADQGKTITQLTVKSIGTRIRAAIVNKLLQNDKDIVAGLEIAEDNISTMQGQISTLQGTVSTLQSNPVSSKGPKVVSTDPANNAVSVISTKVITVTVDQFLYAPTVNNTNIQLKDKDGNIVPITVNYDGAKFITVNHASALSIPASPYALHIGVGVLNVLGESFNNNAEYVLGFSCGTDNFPSKPIITYDTVTQNSARIILSTPSTDDMGSVSYILSYGDGTVIADPATLPYTFPSLLNPNTDYTVKVGAKDSAGQITWSDPVTFHTLTNQAPTVTNVNISGTVGVGNILTGNYTYSDAEGDTEGASTFRWLRNGVAIAGATARTYPIVSADLGTTLTFEVTPVASAGTTTGIAVVSAGLAIPVPLWPDDFTGSSLDSARWLSAVNGGTVTVGSGLCTIDTSGGNKAAIIYSKDKFTKAQNRTIKVKAKVTSATPVDSVIGLALAQATPQVGTVAAIAGPIYRHLSIQFKWTGSAWTLMPGYNPTSDPTNFYKWCNRATPAWVVNPGWNVENWPISANTIYTLIAITTPTGVSFKAMNEGETVTIFQTSELAWSSIAYPTSVGSSPTDYNLLIGDLYTDAYAETVVIDKVDII